jgi:hypothetical protein
MQSFLYITGYFVFSLLGNYNYFFYAAHLLDVAVCFKTLGTILQSVTHNGKQVRGCQRSYFFFMCRLQIMSFSPTAPRQRVEFKVRIYRFELIFCLPMHEGRI